jgi:hypothetical protein
MENETPKISYYALIEDDGSADEAFGLVRRIHAEPVAVDEAIGNDLEWHPSEYLRRYYILGSTDIDHVEVSAEFAEALLERWRERRRAAGR